MHKKVIITKFKQVVHMPISRFLNNPKWPTIKGRIKWDRDLKQYYITKKNNTKSLSLKHNSPKINVM